MLRQRTLLVVTSVLLATMGACQPRPTVLVAAVETPADPAPAALAGVYAYALGPRDSAAVQRIDVVELARVLAAAPSPAADTQRRRAIGMLAAAGTPPRRVGEPWDPPVVDAALRAIGAPMTALTEEFIRWRDRSGPGRPARPSEKKWVAYEALRKTPGPWEQRCCSCLNAWDVDPEPKPADGVAMAYFKVSVPRPHKEVRALMDPQSWEQCSPDFFAATKVIETGKNAKCQSANICTTNEPPLDPSPPNPRSVWQGTLFEHYRNSYLPGGSSSGPTPCNGLPGDKDSFYVRNVLRVAKTRGGGVDQIDYGLCRNPATGALLGPIDSAIDCACEQGGVDVDCGRTWTFERTSDTAWVEGFKLVRFTPRAIDYGLDTWAGIGLQMMIDEIVDDGVCCDPQGSGAPVTCPTCPLPDHVEAIAVPKMSLCGP